LPGSTCQSQAPFKRRPMLASRSRDSCAATAATSRRCYRLAATFAPRATHAAVAPCVTSSRCWSMGEAISPLLVTAAERHPLHFALAALLYSLVAALLCSKRRPPRTALVRLCTTPSWPLSHRPPQEIVEALSWPPPLVGEATLPSSATSGHRRAPPSLQRPPPELTAALWTPSRRSPPLLQPAVTGSPELTCFTTTSPPQWAPPLPMPQIGTLTSRACSLAPPSPATRRRSAGFSLRTAHRWRTGELPCFGLAGWKAQVGQAVFTGWAKRYSKCSPLQQC
jgi:hypothetical protein